MMDRNYTFFLLMLISITNLVWSQEDPIYDEIPYEEVFGGDENNDLSKHCSLCQDGSEITNPDVIVYDGITCAELAEEAFSALPDGVDNDQCRFYHRYGNTCGCNNIPPEETFCTLCQDSNTLPDLALTLNGVDVSGAITCQELQLEAAWNVFSTYSDAPPTCDYYHHLGHLCGCTNNIPPETGCDLCADGSMPAFENKAVTPDIAGAENCAAYQTISKYTIPGSDEDYCIAAQASVGAYCGCSNPPPKPCDLCPGQVVADAIAPTIEGDPVLEMIGADTSITCIEYEFLVSRFGLTCKTLPQIKSTCCISASMSDATEEEQEREGESSFASSSSSWFLRNQSWTVVAIISGIWLSM